MHLTTVMLPPASDEDQTQVFAKLPGLTTFKAEPVGRWFEAYLHRRKHRQTLSHHSLHSSTSDDSAEELSSDEDDENLLATLDPKAWKDQDHYAVLGLGKLRNAATEEQIKRAYKKKVLRHHPDKRRAHGLPVKEGEEDYFTCITRAYETLGSTVKRRSYDSVDPQFDDSIPQNCAESKENFFDEFEPVFRRNARWSIKKRVPELGDENISFEKVNAFYSFWYDFDSWREYSYLDEEEKEKGENREERRWIEKQNKAARQKRKKEESARIRQLVDNAYACDPRIIRFKEEQKEKKLAQKRAKQEAARAKAEEEERIKREALEEERKRKEKEEEEARAQAAAVKKEKEAQKKLLKKEKKIIRTKLKEFDYFANDDNERINNMQEVDKLAEILSTTSLQTLNESLTSGDKEKAKTAFFDQVRELNEKLEEEKRQMLESAQKQSSGSSDASGSKHPWLDDELQLLIKAVNLFPAGTVQRWDTVANFINQHHPNNRTAKEVLAKAKSLQKMDSTLKEEANKKAFDRFSKEARGATCIDKAEKEGISERYSSIVEQQIGETGSNPAPWTAEEQKMLEQAMRTYSGDTPKRWEKIASVIPYRTKKDCMMRYKELCEMVKAKKLAQMQAAKGKKS